MTQNNAWSDETKRKHAEASILIYHPQPIGATGRVYTTKSSWSNHPKKGQCVKVFCMDGSHVLQNAIITEIYPQTFEYSYRIIDSEQLQLF